MKTKRSNGVTVLGNPEKVNKIPREVDNSSDLEMAELKARSKRKWQAPANSIPGRKRTAPPSSETTLPT